MTISPVKSQHIEFVCPHCGTSQKVKPLFFFPWEDVIVACEKCFADVNVDKIEKK